MEKTVPNTDIGRNVVGYMLNSSLSTENQAKVADLQAILAQEYGDALWLTPPETLHITLLDWLAPLVDYKADKGQLFEELFSSYDKALAQILNNIGGIEVAFNKLQASPGAIFIQGSDDGQFNAIRNEFTSRINLLPGTKQPPSIIHFTAARFIKEIELEPLRKLLATQPVYFKQTINQFRLVRETKIPMLEYEVVKQYKLKR